MSDDVLEAGVEAMARLLEKELTAAELLQATVRVAQPHGATPSRAERQSALVFRIASEWLAVAVPAVDEIGPVRSTHRLPHRRGIIEGIVNVRGELVTQVSLSSVCGLQNGPATQAASRRLMVLRHQALRIAWIVDEVAAVEHYTTEDVQPTPSTMSAAASTYSRGMLVLPGRMAGLLDHELLFYSIAKGLL